MSIYPTRTAAHLTLAALVALAAGIAARQAHVVAWGGAIAVGVAFARAVTLVSVMRIRSAGFEMLWTGAGRVAHARRGGEVILKAEVRNRDTLAARYDKLRVIASPALDCRVEPPAGEVKATGSVELTVRVRAKRAGFIGIHGLALEVRGAPGLFEVPLTFANPYGVAVMPATVARVLASPAGGRSRTVAAQGRSGARRGDGSELRELRDHLPGDPFRRIAWKASARRGKLTVRELEREERDVVLLVLDASVELWAGAIGQAPLDQAIDACAALAARHLARGDLVGLTICGARELGSVEPDRGRAQLARIVHAMLDGAGVLDADRSGWDEGDMALQVAEHLRGIDPRALKDLRRGRFDKLAERAARHRSMAPFSRSSPSGRNAIDAELRRHAAAFGLYVPARLEPDRDRAGATIAAVLSSAASRKRPRPSVVQLIGPPPPQAADQALRQAVSRLRRKGIEVRWTIPPLASGLPAEGERQRRTDPPIAAAMRAAIGVRAAAAAHRGEQLLRGMGVRMVRVGRRASMPHSAAPEEPRSA